MLQGIGEDAPLQDGDEHWFARSKWLSAFRRGGIRRYFARGCFLKFLIRRHIQGCIGGNNCWRTSSFHRRRGRAPASVLNRLEISLCALCPPQGTDQFSNEP